MSRERLYYERKCEFYTCSQKFVGDLPEGWCECGVTRQYRDDMHISPASDLAAWCPDHSSREAMAESDAFYARGRAVSR